MIRESVKVMEKIYISVEHVVMEFSLKLGYHKLDKKTAKDKIYELIRMLKLVAVKIGKKIIVLRSSVEEYLEKTPKERKKFINEFSLKDHWARFCKTFLGKWATVEEISKILGICEQTINEYIRKNRSKLKLDSRNNGRGSEATIVNPLGMLGLMRDINE
ncbi:MAG: hypothetical protein ACRC4Z_03180 [Fusobacteriaceae bacterium]